MRVPGNHKGCPTPSVFNNCTTGLQGCGTLHCLQLHFNRHCTGHPIPSTLAIRYCQFSCLTTGSTLDMQPSRQTLAKPPTFTPQEQGSGLDILAGLLHSTHNRVTSTYNPAALLPQRVAKRILNLEFVEMSEITQDDQLPHEQGKSPPPRPTIQDISQWLERYSLMAGILASRFPDKALELFAYRQL